MNSNYQNLTEALRCLGVVDRPDADEAVRQMRAADALGDWLAQRARGMGIDVTVYPQMSWIDACQYARVFPPQIADLPAEFRAQAAWRYCADCGCLRNYSQMLAVSHQFCETCQYDE